MDTNGEAQTAAQTNIGPDMIKPGPRLDHALQEQLDEFVPFASVVEGVNSTHVVKE